jgi:hypothetical protein
MKMHGEAEVKLHHCSPPHYVVVGGQLHGLVALPAGERASDSRWIGGWVGPRAGPEAMEKKILHQSVIEPVVRRSTDRSIP